MQELKNPSKPASSRSSLAGSDNGASVGSAGCNTSAGSIQKAALLRSSKNRNALGTLFRQNIAAMRMLNISPKPITTANDKAQADTCDVNDVKKDSAFEANSAKWCQCDIYVVRKEGWSQIVNRQHVQQCEIDGPEHVIAESLCEYRIQTRHGTIITASKSHFLCASPPESRWEPTERIGSISKDICVAGKTFATTYDVEFLSNAPNSIVVIKAQACNWYRLFYRGRQISVPKLFVIDINPDRLIGGEALALFDYSPAESDELTLKKSDVIRIVSIENREAGWWGGFTLRNAKRIGLFPNNYVHIILLGRNAGMQSAYSYCSLPENQRVDDFKLCNQFDGFDSRSTCWNGEECSSLTSKACTMPGNVGAGNEPRNDDNARQSRVSLSILDPAEQVRLEFEQSSSTCGAPSVRANNRNKDERTGNFLPVRRNASSAGKVLPPCDLTRWRKRSLLPGNSKGSTDPFRHRPGYCDRPGYCNHKSMDIAMCPSHRYVVGTVTTQQSSKHLLDCQVVPCLSEDTCSINNTLLVPVSQCTEKKCKKCDRKCPSATLYSRLMDNALDEQEDQEKRANFEQISHFYPERDDLSAHKEDLLLNHIAYTSGTEHPTFSEGDQVDGIHSGKQHRTFSSEVHLIEGQLFELENGDSVPAELLSTNFDKDVDSKGSCVSSEPRLSSTISSRTSACSSSLMSTDKYYFQPHKFHKNGSYLRDDGITDRKSFDRPSKGSGDMTCTAEMQCSNKMGPATTTRFQPSSGISKPSKVDETSEAGKLPSPTSFAGATSSSDSSSDDPSGGSTKSEAHSSESNALKGQTGSRCINNDCLGDRGSSNNFNTSKTSSPVKLNEQSSTDFSVGAVTILTDSGLERQYKIEVDDQDGMTCDVAIVDTSNSKSGPDYEPPVNLMDRRSSNKTSSPRSSVNRPPVSLSRSSTALTPRRKLPAFIADKPPLDRNNSGYSCQCPSRAPHKRLLEEMKLYSSFILRGRGKGDNAHFGGGSTDIANQSRQYCSPCAQKTKLAVNYAHGDKIRDEILSCLRASNEEKGTLRDRLHVLSCQRYRSRSNTSPGNAGATASYLIMTGQSNNSADQNEYAPCQRITVDCDLHDHQPGSLATQATMNSGISCYDYQNSAQKLSQQMPQRARVADMDQTDDSDSSVSTCVGDPYECSNPCSSRPLTISSNVRSPYYCKPTDISSAMTTKSEDCARQTSRDNHLLSHALSDMYIDSHLMRRHDVTTTNNDSPTFADGNDCQPGTSSQGVLDLRMSLKVLENDLTCLIDSFRLFASQFDQTYMSLIADIQKDRSYRIEQQMDICRMRVQINELWTLVKTLMPRVANATNGSMEHKQQ